ncbi:hypothetical protein KW803_00750 [Candidatus Saccharibacteria bacterium]|nr:hypothetical protein [Candidatus Saccharibacteria bacterium]
MKLWVPVVSFKQIDLSSKKHTRGAKTKSAFIFRRSRLFVPAAAVLVVALLIGLVWRNLSSPNHGQIAVLSAETTPDTKLPEFTTLTTGFYSFNYSQRYNQIPTDIAPAGILDQKILAYKLGGQPGQSKIEAIIKAAPYGGITLDSTYDYYLKHGAQYKMSNRLYGGEIVDIAKSKKGQPPETIALWLHNGFLLTVKLTTADVQQKIDGELNDVLSSVQWRE